MRVEAMVRIICCALAMVASVAAPSYAQDTYSPSAAYVEIGGSTIFYSLNAELPVGHNRAVRIGAMVLPQTFGVTSSLNQLVGRGEYRLILGLGLTLVGGSDSSLAAGTATIGYRRTRSDGSFFQLAATPFITNTGIRHYVGVSFGKSY
jgi:hypothetical protein